MLAFAVFIALFAWAQFQGAIVNGYTCTFPSAKNTTYITSMLSVTSNTDFAYMRLSGSGSAFGSSCSVSGTASASHILSIADGVTVKNLILGAPGKGVWCKGSCTLQNVYWENVCYHAAGFADDSGTGAYKTHQVIGGAARNAPDKFFTQSSYGQTIVSGFCGQKFTTAVASCGNCSPYYKRSIVFKNSTFTGYALELVSLNAAKADTVSFSSVYLQGYKTASTTICYACREWDIYSQSAISSTASTPVQNGKGTSCSYSSSGIVISS